MLKSENGSAEIHFGLKDDGTSGCMMSVDIKAPLKVDNQLAEALVKGESVLSLCDSGLEPYEGMEFESEEAARIFYNAYARRVGFRIRISKYSRSRRDNSVISRQIVCSKEGFREVRAKKGLFGERRQRQRAVTRVGCKAMIMVKKLSSGRWIVSKFVKEHNHGAVPPKNLVRIVHDVDAAVEKPVPNGGGSSIQEPFEGMEFDSEEAAKSFYNAYARCMGFRARVSKYCRSRRDNSIISRRLVCSKEGFREIRIKKETCDEGKTKRPRAITRIGCKAMIIVKRVSSEKWVVSRFEKEHNHALVSSKKILYLQSQHYDRKNSGGNLKELGEVQSGLIKDGCNPVVRSTFKGSLNVLYTQLCHEAIKYAQEGATTEDSYNVAMAALKEAVEKVATAKKNDLAATQKNPATGTSQRHFNNPIFQANLHDSCSSNELRLAVSAQEVVLLQQPVNLVLIPSGFTSDSANQNQPAGAPFIINTPETQKQQSPATSAEGLTGNGSFDSRSSSGRKRKLEVTADGSKESDGNTKKSQVDFVSIGQTSLAQSSGNNLLGPGLSEAQLIAIPALPVALYMPMVGSLPASCAVATSVAPGNYAFLAAPIGAMPLSARSAEPSTPFPQGSSPSAPFADGKLDPPASMGNSATTSKHYTGPNPQIHAAALAAGARIVHPSAAASLMKTVEARIRSRGGTLVKSTFIDGAKPLAIRPPVSTAWDVQTGPGQ